MAPADRLRPASRTRLALAAVLLAAAGVLVILSRSKHADEPPERARSEHRGGDVPHLIEWSATPVDADAVWGVDGLATVFDMPASSISLGVPVVTRLRVDAAVHLARSADWWLLWLGEEGRVVSEHVGESLEGPSDATSSVMRRVAERIRERGATTLGLLVADDAPWPRATSLLELALRQLLPSGGQVVIPVLCDGGIAELPLRLAAGPTSASGWLSTADQAGAAARPGGTTRFRIVSRPAMGDGLFYRTRIILRDPEERESGPSGPSRFTVLLGDREKTEEYIGAIEELLSKAGATTGGDIELLISPDGSGSWKELRTALLAAARVSGRQRVLVSIGD